MAKNIRWQDGSLRSRWAVETVAPPPPGGGTALGGIELPFGDSQSVALVALAVPGQGSQVWANVFNGSAWGGWFEVTSSSGQNGNTRLTGNKCLFCATKLGVFVQDGVSLPRLISLSALGSGSARIMRAIPAPSALVASNPVFGGGKRLNLSLVPTVTDSGQSRLTFDSSWQLNLANPSVGDWAQASVTPVTFTHGRQVWIVVSPSAGSHFDPVWLRSFRWEVVLADGSRQVIQDVEAGIDNAFAVETNSPATALFAFPLSLPPGGWSVQGMRLTVISGFSFTGNLSFQMVSEGGKVPGGATYGVSWANPGSRCEGPGIVLGLPQLQGAESGKARTLLTKGGVQTLAGTRLPSGFLLPLDGRLTYEVRVPVTSSPSSDANQGVSQIRLYRRDGGEDAFSLIQEITAASWNGTTWSPVAPFSGFGVSQVVEDHVGPEEKDFTQALPDSGVLTPPVGEGMASWGDRLGIISGNRIWLSEAGKPASFRASARTLQGIPLWETAFTADLPESEKAVALLSQPGTGALLVFGQNNLYRLSRFQLSLVAKVSCASPHAVCQSQTSLFWVGARGEVWRWGSSLAEITIGRIPRFAVPGEVKVGAHGERVFFGTSGGAMIWNEVIKEWESEDVFQPRTAAWLRSGTHFLLALDSAGSLRRHEMVGLTNPVESAVRFSIPASSPDQRMSLRRGLVESAPDPSGTMTFTRLFRHGSPPSVGSATLAGGVWRHDQAPNGGVPGGVGYGAEVLVEWQGAGGLAITTLAIELGQTVGGGPDATP
ncbi:MAG: hypothetical protein MUC92_04670 [Fimbriimonadaceae bacterium]|nr:hypothetical protein [Fimbriimonadaceae bacterium]